MKINKYQKLKEKARNEAMSFELSFSTYNYSYSELCKKFEYFTKLGKRYGLIKEFMENGIL